jgi:aquaporin Z
LQHLLLQRRTDQLDLGRLLRLLLQRARLLRRTKLPPRFGQCLFLRGIRRVWLHHEVSEHRGSAVTRAISAYDSVRMLQAFRAHWPEYVFEALGLAVFMVSACLCTALLEYAGSPLHQAIANATLRRALLGLGMGLTATGIVYSPWGQRSGAHINPAVTLTFLRLGKIAPWDAAFYIPAQFIGGVLGVLLSAAIIPHAIADHAVCYAVTVPGKYGVEGALIAELVIAFVLMSVVLLLGSFEKIAPFTGAATGISVTLNVFFVAPISGFGMNPARTAGSAIVSGIWTAWWVYFFAPPAAMLLAAELHLRMRGERSMACAKLHHSKRVACIFCGFRPEMLEL